MATCFLDIVPHIKSVSRYLNLSFSETYENYKADLAEARGVPELEIEFPYPQLFTCVGFFLVYLVEEVCMRVFSMGHSHSHSPDPTPPITNDFVRRGSANLRK